MKDLAVPWKPSRLDDSVPLYLAIAEALAADIADGRVGPGERLPPQRRLAELIGVDLSTVTRALAECRRRGLVEGTVGRGTFVAADTGAPLALARVEQASREGFIEMGHVLPLYAQERRGVEALRRGLGSMDLARFLRYTDPAGMPEHRAAGAAWAARAGVRVRPECVLVTAGSQNALACCLLALFNPGEALAVEELTFTGLKSLARMKNVRLVPVEMDAGGVLPDALERVCRREHPRGVYLMPDIQNPTTAVLSRARRQEVARVIERNNLILIEDDSYGHAIGRRTALSALAPDHGIYVGGTAKAFAAGLRVSFVACPARHAAQLEAALMGTVWMASPLNAELMRRATESGLVDSIIAAKRAEARARTALMRRALSAHRVSARDDGFFAWLALPPGWTGRDLELAAREAGVRVFAAERFAVGGRAAPAAARLSLTGPATRAELSRGLSILSAVLAGGRRAARPVL
jgi:DNA-binding transcriptional MocR family regulator